MGQALERAQGRDVNVMVVVGATSTGEINMTRSVYDDLLYDGFCNHFNDAGNYGVTCTTSNYPCA
uniref:hypothetical protein n=1 Tax=Paractinoplanes polyasparticus TaxID=2856853 RepID=UPI001C865A7A|nr:hypothetical protein [Actinoplanes polyasparticus]